MRIRNLIVAAFAAALAGTLFAVPAFADDDTITLTNGDYGTVSISVGTPHTFDELPYFNVGMFRSPDGIVLLADVPPGFHISASNPDWMPGNSSESLGVPVTETYTATSTGKVRYFLWDDQNVRYVIVYDVLSLGTVGNSTQGLFGMVSYAVQTIIDWLGTWINSITGNPILLFFCLALPLLTIGITIIRRMLAVRA